jgi:hypothetical protein
MIREEEDDLTQEMRALVISQADMIVRERFGRIINKILAERPEVKSEYTEGVVDGLEWAVRIISGDKSAS